MPERLPAERLRRDRRHPRTRTLRGRRRPVHPSSLPPRARPPNGRRIAIVGAGPVGLTAAYHLQLAGFACTVFDRQPLAGGSLRRRPAPSDLPSDVLDADVKCLADLGIEFRLGHAFGPDLTTEQLRTTYDATLIAIGERTRAELESLGLPAGGSGVQADPETGLTRLPSLFAAGSVVKPVRQLVRAMSEGESVARCIEQFVSGQPLRAPRRAFSSVMGRLEPGELELFLRGVNGEPRITPSRGLTFGFTPTEARSEASRCLHCDCRAAGHCALQHYAQQYGAEPNRFAKQRRRFRQELHPADVLFEPGKCILCGICIEIARQAAEPLGLTFVGRGFDVQVAAPLGRGFADGLQKVAAECVAHCPTGAIVFREGSGRASVQAATTGGVSQ
jgi:ferredoxin